MHPRRSVRQWFWASRSTNLVNQYRYTAVADTVPDQGSVTATLNYNLDGDLTADGSLSYQWAGEDPLVKAWTGDLDNPASGNKKVEFKYDYMGRRVEKRYRV